MKSIGILLTGLFLMLMTASCVHHVEATIDGNSWLNSKTGVPTINITGVWDGGPAFGGGWGEGRFVQNGREVTGSLGVDNDKGETLVAKPLGQLWLGSLGLYNVKGVVSGEDVYFLIFKAGTIYDTAHLRLSPDGTLTGKAAEGAIVDQTTGNVVEYPMILRRMPQ